MSKNETMVERNEAMKLVEDKLTIVNNLLAEVQIKEISNKLEIDFDALDNLIVDMGLEISKGNIKKPLLVIQKITEIRAEVDKNYEKSIGKGIKQANKFIETIKSMIGVQPKEGKCNFTDFIDFENLLAIDNVVEIDIAIPMTLEALRDMQRYNNKNFISLYNNVAKWIF